MRLKIALVAVLALVVQAQGAPVSPSEAASAVRGWAASGEHLGVGFRDRLDFSSGAVETTAVHTASSGAVFYTVKFKNGCGTVFLSGDTELEPVISFTASSRDYSTRDGSPLWTLLDGDVSARKPTDGASSKWNRYWAADPEKPRLRGARLTSEPSDLRIAPLIQSKWGQTSGIYNYYTPPGPDGSPDNYHCGCVATMTAQIMRYYHGPEGDGGWGLPLKDVEPAEFNCTVDGKPTKLAIQGGQYAWDSMPLIPDETAGETIGKLTSDIGISVGMDYAADGSEASIYYAIGSLVNVFKYKQGIYIQSDFGTYFEYGGSMMCDAVLQGSIFANLDVRRPCMLGISGTTAGGHAVVVDGYGFDGEEALPYVHLNMGWEGYEDYWYNLPDIVTTPYEFDVVDCIGYNIFPEIGGIDGYGTLDYSVMSGRVLTNGNPVVGAQVTIYKTGSVTALTNVVSDEHGVWGAIIPSYELYDAEAKFEGRIGVTNNVLVMSPMVNWLGGKEVTVGNSWGNDIVLADPLVDVEGEPFVSLDRAIVGAREKYAETSAPVEIKILGAGAEFVNQSTIDFECVMFATNSAPRESAVARGGNAMLTVAAGSSLVMSNVVFAAEKGADTVVDVEAGGALSIAGIVDFCVGYKNAAVKTADGYGFRLLGAIDKDCGFTLSCATAANEDQVVGFCRATKAGYAALTNSVSHIANFADETRESRACMLNLGEVSPPNPAFNYKLVWRNQDVPFEDAVAYYVDNAGKTNTAGRIDTLLDKYADALANGDLPENREIGIRRDDTLSRPLAIDSKLLSIVGEGVEVVVETSAGFTVTGGSLSVSGISFSGYKGNALFLVNGEGAALSLSDVAVLDTEGTNEWSGAVAILKGEASVAGSTFDGCRATGKYSKTRSVSSNGGAIHVADGCRLYIEDSTIVNCTASDSGGGIYAGANAVVSLSGEMAVHDNKSGSGNSFKTDDIYLKNTSAANAQLLASDEVTGSVGVRWSKDVADGYGNSSGLKLADAASAAVATASAKAFFTDGPSDVIAVADGTALRWADAPVGPQPLPSAEGAFACVKSGSTTTYYASVADALTVAKAGEAVYVVPQIPVSEDDDTTIPLDRDVTITNNILLASVDGDTIWRTNDYTIIVVAGASLTVSNVAFNQSVDFDATKPLFDVQGGTLTLDAGAAISGVRGDSARDAGAVSVWQGGTFAMKSGAIICRCSNFYESQSDGCGRGAGVLVDDGKAVFTGGDIYDCKAYTGGGVFIGNKGEIEVSGDTKIVNNTSLDDSDSNLVVYDNGRLVLAGALADDASIGYTEGVSGDTNVFATVAAGVSDADALASAHKFKHDVTGDVGMAVKNGGTRLLVWSAALDDNGKYKDEDGAEYVLISDDNVGKVKIPVPSAVAGLVYDGAAKTGVVESVGFTVVSNVWVNAGDYVATAKLRPGYVWINDWTGATNVDWSINPATYDMSGVAFNDMEVAYDGNWHEIVIEGELPNGVTVSYENNRRREVGSQTATAHFTGDESNYFPIPDKKATLTILENEEPTPPEEDPPGPSPSAKAVQIDFSVLKSDDGKYWKISVTDVVEKCWYSLYETNSLAGGFKIDGVDPVSRRQATKDEAEVKTIVFERLRTGEQLFWRVKAEDENKHTWPDDEITD